MGKNFTPSSPPVRSTDTGTAPVANEKPVLFRGARRGKKDDRPSPAPYIADSTTKAVGGTWFVTGWRMDGCQDGAGRRYLFSRWYPEQSILVDAFAKMSDAACLEVARKSDFLRAYNGAHPQGKIGYLPYVVGSALDGHGGRAHSGDIVEFLGKRQFAGTV